MCRHQPQSALEILSNVIHSPSCRTVFDHAHRVTRFSALAPRAVMLLASALMLNDTGRESLLERRRSRERLLEALLADAPRWKPDAVPSSSRKP